MSNWICINNPNHVFSDSEASDNNYFCPSCAFGEGILVESTGVKTMRNLGLCIMLLDCSGSMGLPAFQNHPLSKRELVARSVTAGIYSLSGLSAKEDAYILIIGFDHQVDILMPLASLKEIFSKYPDHEEYERILLEKMSEKNGATNINEALTTAYNFTQKFINSEIESLGEYSPRIQSVADENFAFHDYPNVRVLLFTDGEHYMGDGDTTIKPSPFNNLTYEGRHIDILMSAYYGNEGERGHTQLKNLVRNCPIHTQTPQFFLFDDPTKVTNLKGLFRMASGASGFCPKCLGDANTVVRDNS